MSPTHASPGARHRGHVLHFPGRRERGVVTRGGRGERTPPLSSRRPFSTYLLIGKPTLVVAPARPGTPAVPFLCRQSPRRRLPCRSARLVGRRRSGAPGGVAHRDRAAKGVGGRCARHTQRAGRGGRCEANGVGGCCRQVQDVCGVGGGSRKDVGQGSGVAPQGIGFVGPAPADVDDDLFRLPAQQQQIRDASAVHLVVDSKPIGCSGRVPGEIGRPPERANHSVREYVVTLPCSRAGVCIPDRANDSSVLNLGVCPGPSWRAS